MVSILEKKKNVHSQNGEDGIIEYVFDTLGIQIGKFIEFGAWDGKLHSNTYNLYEKGWKGVYIEGDENKYSDLIKSFAHDNGMTCLNRMVGYSETDNLDLIIDESQYKDCEFDIVSIDVDGVDYNIFERMRKYLPKVILIEVNAGHDPLYDKEIPVSISYNNIGQSITVISREAEKKGYFPLCYTGNLFLIQNQYIELFKPYIKTTESIYIDFLHHLESTNKGGLHYLFIIFVMNKRFNGFLFENQTLQREAFNALIGKFRHLDCYCVNCGGQWTPSWCVKALQNQYK